MSHKDPREGISRLDQINDELTESLKRCRGLLSACRSQLAANGNDVGDGDDEEPPAIRAAD